MPAKLWKVVVCVEGGDGSEKDIGRVTAETRVIAVVMPNDQSVTRGWGKYRVSVSDIEELTGYRFFTVVSEKVIGPLRKEVDDGPTR